MRSRQIAILFIMVGVLGCRRDVAEPVDRQAVRPGAEMIAAEHVREIEMVNLDTGKVSRNKAYFNEVTKEFEWTPAVGDRGRYKLNIKARGQGMVQEEEIIITVRGTD